MYQKAMIGMSLTKWNRIKKELIEEREIVNWSRVLTQTT